MEIKVHPLHQRDIDDVLRVQRSAYAEGFLEDADSFIAKVSASPRTSFAAWQDSTMVGYLIAVPLDDDSGFDLNTSQIPAIPFETATMIYIHDVAVHPEVRGGGVARCLLSRLEEAISGTSMREWKLVSVQGSREFWEKHGFEASPKLPPNGYGPEAVLMLRR